MKLYYNIKQNPDIKKQTEYFVSYIEDNDVKTDVINFTDYFVVKKSSEVEKELNRGKAFYSTKTIETLKNEEYFKVKLNMPMVLTETDENRAMHKALRNFVYNITKKFKSYEYDVYPPVIKVIYENKIQFLKENIKLNELPYCVFDIETQTTSGSFPTPDKNFAFYIGARGINIKGEEVKFYKSVADYTDKVDEYGNIGEREMLKDFLKFLDDNKFIIISGYNIYNFDIYFIAERLKKYNIPFKFNDDEIYQNRNPNREDGTQRHPLVKFQNPQYKEYVSKKGRIVFFDIFYYLFRTPMERQAIKYKYGLVSLKNVSDYFHTLPKKERVIIEGGEIYNEFLKNPKYMTQYLIDDVESTYLLYLKFAPILFYLSYYVNQELGQIFNASSTQILERGLYKNMKKKNLYIFPQRRDPYTAEELKNYGGGNTKIHAVGYFRNIIKIDFSSLYPSIMLDWNIKPENDEDGIFIQTLKGLYEERIGFKKEGKKLKKIPEKERTAEEENNLINFENYSAALKILINSAYGLLGYRSWKNQALPGSRFTNVPAASKVTEVGRNMVTTIEDICLKKGYTIIETDTDGIIVTDLKTTNEKEIDEGVIKLMNEMNNSFRILGKQYATLDVESIDSGMISIKKKNYVVFDISKDGEVDVSSHGSTFVDSRKPTIIKKTINDIITYIVEAPDMNKLLEKYNFLFISTPLKKEYDFIEYCKKFNKEDFLYSITLKEISSYKTQKTDTEQKAILKKYESKHGKVTTADLQIQYYKSFEGTKAMEKDELAEDFDRSKLDYRFYLKEIKKSLITLMLYTYNLELMPGTNVSYNDKDKKVSIKDLKVENPYSDDAIFDKYWYKSIFKKLTNEKRQDILTTIYNHKIVGESGSFFRPLLKNLLYPPTDEHKAYLNKVLINMPSEHLKKLKELYYLKKYKTLEDNSQEKERIQKELNDDELYLFDTQLFEKYFPN